MVGSNGFMRPGEIWRANTIQASLGWESDFFHTSPAVRQASCSRDYDPKSSYNICLLCTSLWMPTKMDFV